MSKEPMLYPVRGKDKETNMLEYGETVNLFPGPSVRKGRRQYTLLIPVFTLEEFCFRQLIIKLIDNIILINMII